MTWVATAIVGGAVIGGIASNRAADTQASAARDAAGSQLDATQRSIDAQREMFNQAAGYLAPYRGAGTDALSNLGAGNVQYDLQGRPVWRSMTNADLATQLAPAYQFQLDQGLGALSNQMNRAGGLVGGNAQQALQQYAQNYAANAYQQAFQNFNTNQANQQQWWQQGLSNYLTQNQQRYAQLMGVAQLGQNSAAGTGSNAISTGANVANTTMSGATSASNYLTSGAAASAAGQVGVSNAFNGGLSSYLGWNYLNGRNQPQTAPASLSPNYWEGQFNPNG